MSGARFMVWCRATTVPGALATVRGAGRWYARPARRARSHATAASEPDPHRAHPAPIRRDVSHRAVIADPWRRSVAVSVMAPRRLRLRLRLRAGAAARDRRLRAGAAAHDPGWAPAQTR
jgi:hypothetical protein